MNNDHVYKIALMQSAVDLSCSPSDFLKNENVIVLSKENSRARRYLSLPFSCNLVTYGSNIVASVSPELYDIVNDYINKYSKEHCFETPNMYVLNDKLEKFDNMVCFMAEYFLPDLNCLCEKECSYETRVLEKTDFENLYTDMWSNALCKKRKQLDMLCIGAYDKGELIGLAGVSADCEDMWQIGIDVNKNYRGNGIATSLVSQIAIETVKRGKVPFYCAAWSNIASVRTALKSGFRPSWCELTAKKKDFVSDMNK